jgi:hypothetical protein
MKHLSTLPKSNSNEDLETLSRNKFALLLDPTKFELRQETIRDKGVDLVIEIKENGRYTNYRFIVQLKATAKPKVNNKQMMSFPLEVSNINYLLNYGMPAYYVLYHSITDQFYIANAKDVFKAMILKYNRKTLPQRYSYKFTEKLNDSAIESIYQEALHSGQLLRKLNSHIPPTVNQSSGIGIMIDEDNDVYSVTQNIGFIEQCGFRLLNEFQFQRIIEIEQRTYLGSTVASPMFNYVCGMAYFHKAELFKSIDYLKKADRQAFNFESDQQAILKHILLQNKYLLGIITREVYDGENQKLLERENLGSFLEIEKACQQFYRGEGSGAEKMNILYKNISGILASEPDNEGARVVGYAKILGIEMTMLTNDLSKNLTNLFWFGGSYLKEELYKRWEVLEQQYFDRVAKVINYAGPLNDVLAMSNLTLHHLEWAYKTAYIRQFFDNWDSNAHTAGRVRDDKAIAQLIRKSGMLEKVYEFCEEISHVETQVFCLCQKYKIEDFTDQVEPAYLTLQRLLKLIEKNDLQPTHQKNYQELLDGETEHEVFYQDTQERMAHFYKVVANSGINLTLINNPPAENLDAFDKHMEWSVTDFLEFNLPDRNSSSVS